MCCKVRPICAVPTKLLLLDFLEIVVEKYFKTNENNCDNLVKKIYLWKFYAYEKIYVFSTIVSGAIFY